MYKNIMTQTVSQIESRQLEIFPVWFWNNDNSPQIKSIPGTHPSIKNRYQLTLGSKTIASQLDADEASRLAGLIRERDLTGAIEFLEGCDLLDQEVQVFLLGAIGGAR